MTAVAFSTFLNRLAAALDRIVLSGGASAGAGQGGVAVGTQLTIVTRPDAREYIGVLSWDAPPSLPAIEHLLQANIGRGIGVIGELDV